MADSFDAYYKWLGIPPAEQPPNHYRLLGVSLFESHAEVISNAADRQMLLLRTFQSGKSSALSQKLLNEVAAARVCLLSPEKKTVYDARLRKMLAAKRKPKSGLSAEVQSASSQESSTANGFPDLRRGSDARQRSRQAISRSRQRRIGAPLLAVGGGSIALGILVVVLLVVFSGDQQDPPVAKRDGLSSVPTTTKMDNKAPTDVNEKPRPPVLDAIPDQTVKTGEELHIEVRATHVGTPTSELQFNLKPDAPTGMKIDRSSGIITWRPPADFPPGEYKVTVHVQIKTQDQLADKKTFLVKLAKMQESPKLAAIADRTVQAGEPFSFTIQVADPGVETDQLRFHLISGAPVGMKIDPNRGVITWHPAKDMPVGEHLVAVRVESVQSAQLGDEKTFRLRVTAAKPKSPEENMGDTEKVAVTNQVAVPDQSEQDRALAELKNEFKKEYASRQAYVAVALAARMIRQAREAEPQSVKMYVLLQQARKLASNQGNCLLPGLAVDRLAANFKVDAIALKTEDLTIAAQHVRMSIDIDLIVKACHALAKKAATTKTYDALLIVLRRVEKITSKGSRPGLAKTVQETRKAMQAMQELCQQAESATATLKTDPDNGAANSTQGRFYCLAHGDWKKGISMLAKADEDRMRRPAVKLLADRNDVAAQLDMADVWWKEAQKKRSQTGDRLLLESAARYWYELALPRLADEDLARAESRLFPRLRRGKRQSFLMSLNGLGGISSLTPKKISGKVLPAGQFAILQGDTSIQYDRVPAAAYIHELELTLPQPRGVVRFNYGDSNVGARMVFSWNSKVRKFDCRLYTYVGGMVYWAYERGFMPGQTVQLTLYAHDNHQWLYQEGTRILGTGARPTDLQFSISSDAQAMAVISRCEFRPWTKADATRLNCAMPPMRIDADWADAGYRLIDRSFGLSDHPVLTEGTPFLLGTTRTAMQWLPAGSFKRKSPPNKKKPAAAENVGTEITLTRGFWIGRYEISQGEWAAVVPNPGNAVRVAGSPFLPVDGARYEDAVKFCQLLTQLEKRAKRLPPGYQYRLPTEAEWEYACRAGSNDDFSVDVNGFWSAETSLNRPHEIGQGKPNPWNLYDMHGNVDEWCFDAWRDEPETPVFRLTDPVARPQSATDFFVLRGGAWWKGRKSCTSGAREKSKSVAGGYRGFRIVLGPVLR